MDKYIDGAKGVVKSVVPERVLTPLRERYLRATNQQGTAGSPTPVSAPGTAITPAAPGSIHRHDPTTRDEPDFLTIGWLRRHVAEAADPGLTSYFAIIPEDDVPSLCAPSDSYRALLDTLVAVIVRSNLQIGHSVGGEHLLVSDYDELIRDLSSGQSVRIRLVSGERELTLFLEEWQDEKGVLTAPRPNPVTMKIYLDSDSAKVFLDTPGQLLRALYPMPLAETVTFDIDVVYTWVNSDDPEWHQQLLEHSESAPEVDRYLNRDELKYSLRSLLTFAPWVRNVYVVTNCAPPEWFDATNQRVRWVYHEEIIDEAHLPTFNSHAIETAIHRVPGLSEHFLYFNDDLFFLRPVSPSEFFLANGIAKVRPEPYGMIHGELDPDDEDYINAARNVQKLLEAEFAKTVTKLYTHSPRSMSRSVAEQCESRFAEAYAETRGHRFRSITDISPTSGMYPNFAFLTGNAVFDYPAVALVNNRRPYRNLLDRFRSSMAAARYGELPLAFCVNDGGGSALDQDWGDAVVEFMQSAFPEASEAESGRTDDS